MATLGIHDLHDCGVALVKDGEVLGAINEERFTKRKNDVGFPVNSIEFMKREFEKEEISNVAIPWISGSALFARMFPSYEKRRREIWRREVRKPSRFRMSLVNLGFKLIQNQNPKGLWNAAGESIGGGIIRKKLSKLGIEKKITFVDHHLAHASCAYYASGFKNALVLTLDGAGDGLCGSVSIGENGELRRLNSFKGSASLGILYGAATLACDMRYSEDEGKLMSLAAYSYPAQIPELNNISMYDEQSKQLVSRNSKKYELLLAEHFKETLLWRHSREAFAFAVQRHVEEQVVKIVRQYIKETGMTNLAVAGGLFSNIVVNMALNEMPEVKNFFVFPHVGDGGLSTGAAYYVDFKKNGKMPKRQIDNLYYGPEYSDAAIEEVLKRHRHEKQIEYREIKDIERFTAEKIAKENRIMLWFQGRMEYGPRALGNRSVLALASDQKNRNKINIIIKKRPYYQPFASSILEEDAKELLDPCIGVNRFMTVGYKTTEESYKELVAASHIDGSTRPQMLGDENKRYRKLIEYVKRETGVGALLNTSFNKHGMPIVMTPEDAIWTLMNTGAEQLAIGNFFVEKVKK